MINALGFRVICDSCHYEQDFEHALSALEAGTMAEEDGWVIDGDDGDECPDCLRVGWVENEEAE
jgi:hypothetical protein